ncbi:MAG: hypothetical protein ACOY6K_24525 [Pseudomonadota bacterium]
MIRFDEFASCSAMPRLGEAQRARLRQLAECRTAMVIWDRTTTTVPPGALVMVLEPLNAVRAEALAGLLDSSAVVVVAGAEHPAFDAVKARFETHGLIGADHAEAPHQLWWGGREPVALPTGVYRRDGVLIVSCAGPAAALDQRRRGLSADIARLGLDAAVETLPSEPAEVFGCAAKIDMIWRQLERTDRPVLWIDPEAAVKELPMLPQALEYDVAFHRRADGIIDTRVMAFRPSAATAALFKVWRRLNAGFPALPESYVFDQAWIVTSAQRQLETVWLPRSYCESDPMIQGAVVRVPPSPPRGDSELQISRPPAAHRFGRPQQPEPVLIMQSPDPCRRPVTVAIRQEADASVADACTAIEAIASAFATDSGGFARLEVVLCDGDEIDPRMGGDGETWVVLTEADEPCALDAFVGLAQLADLAEAEPDNVIAEASADPRAKVVRGPQRYDAGLGPFVRYPLPA